MAKANNRNSSIELLRIFSMFAIVLHHYALKGTFNWVPYKTQYSGAIKVNLFFHYFGKLGVVIFVMIGAYFLCEKSFNFRRPINLIVTTAFYSFGFYFLFKLTMPSQIWGNDNWVRTLLPFPLPSGYWFVYAYVVMLLAMPFLNIIINSLSREKLLALIVGLIILWSLLVVGLWIFSDKPDTSVDDFGYTPATYFFLLYFISAYIRKYSGKILNSKRYTVIGTLICLLICALISSCAINQKIMSGLLDIFDLNSPLVLVTAIFVFSFFKNCKFQNSVINYIAQSMFGIYLIHEDSFVRPFIWQRIFSSIKFENSGMEYLIYGLGCSLIVFICTLVLDILIRRLLFSHLINKISNYLSTYTEKTVNKLK